MPLTCGACKEVMVDGEGNPRADCPHACVECKAPLHSIINECNCQPWMPVANFYFCNSACLKAHNAKVIAEAASEVREEDDPTPFGPGAYDWDDWLESNPNRWFSVRLRPDGEDDDLSQAASPRRSLLQVKELLAEGTRVQENFRASGTDTVGAFFGGVVGPPLSGNFPIGYDDGDMVMRTEEEVRQLFEDGKFGACTSRSGLVAGNISPLSADRLCYMKCGKAHAPVGVLLKNADDPHTGLPSPLFHSHVVTPAAVKQALDSQQGSRPVRMTAARMSSNPDSAGYHTFRRGDLVGFIGGNEDDYSEEIVYGVLVFRDGSQQRRYLITFASALALFSIAAWTSWKRLSLTGETLFDPDEGEVQVADRDAVKIMEEAWPESHLFSCVTKDKLKNAAKLGPASLQQKRKDDLKSKEMERKRLERKRKSDDRAREARERADRERAGRERERADRERTDREQQADRERADRARAARGGEQDEFSSQAHSPQPTVHNEVFDLVGEDGDAGSTGGRSASVQQKQKRSGTAHGHERADRERADRERTIRERTDRYLALPPPPPPPPPPPGPPPQSLWVEARTAEGTVYFWNTATRAVSWSHPEYSSLASGPISGTAAGSSSNGGEDKGRYDMSSPQAIRREIRTLRREHFVLTRELREVADPTTRQRLARELAGMEIRLLEWGVFL